MFRRRSHLLIAISLLAISACAQTASQYTASSLPEISPNFKPYPGDDRHLEDTSAGVLYQNSAFAHGYRHGYEQGFHVGDIDVHMGRAARPISKLKEYQQSTHEYFAPFGSKLLFQQGYEAGLKSGYGDAIFGREFRASQRFRNLAAGLNELGSPSHRSDF